MNKKELHTTKQLYILFAMDMIKRLICEYDKPVLYIHIDGNIVSGDLINFSYSMTRRLSKTNEPFYIFCDLANAHFSLIEGLAQKVFETFISEALNKELIRCSILLPDSMSIENIFTYQDIRIKLFKNDYSAALAWLSGNSSIQNEAPSKSHVLVSR